MSNFMWERSKDRLGLLLCFFPIKAYSVKAERITLCKEISESRSSITFSIFLINCFKFYICD